MSKRVPATSVELAGRQCHEDDSTNAELTFDHFVIRRAQRELLIDGQPVVCRARAFDLLLALADRRDRVLGKRELLDLVWPRLIVEENNLHVHISALRKLLGSRVIVTVPGRGYQFVAEPRMPVGAEGAVNGIAHTPKRADEPGVPALTNLPQRRTDLIGRARYMVALQAQLAAYRLVTIVGPGGMGKTRLAQAAGFDRLSAYAGGIWFVELAPLVDPRIVLDTIARSVGVSLDAGASAEQLGALIADRHMLLVLDNCEHLIDAVAHIAATLLRTAPLLQILATSQEPLKVPEEVLLHLGALSIPDNTGVEPTGLSADDQGALVLFESAARAVEPRFAIHSGNRATIIDICRRLDGIPLAIEFAAARLQLLGVEALRRRLDERLKLLTSGARTAPPRQQTLRATLEWSHALLNDMQQRVFRRLGIFAGSFGLHSVEQVAEGEEHDDWSVLDALGALVDKSLVMVEAGDPPRYRLLESARAFALEHLHAAGESTATARRHSVAMLALFERGSEEQWTVTSAELLARLLPDIDNLRCALSWAAGKEADATTLIALAGACCWLWRPVGLPTEGLVWCRTAMDRSDAATPPALLARLLLEYASLSYQREAHREMASVQQSVLLYRTLGDRSGLYRALTLLARKRIWRHDLAGAREALCEAEQIYDASWPPALRGTLLQARCYLFEQTGCPADGHPMIQELVALMRTLGDVHRLDLALMELGESLFNSDRVDEAIEVRRELAQRLRSQRLDYAGMNLQYLSAALAFRGESDIPEALELAREALPMLLRQGRLPTCLDNFALLACRRRRWADAGRIIGRAEAEYRESGFHREMCVQRTSDMAYAMLAEALTRKELERLLVEGARMPAAELVRAVMSD